MPNKVSMVTWTDLVGDDARFIGAINAYYIRSRQGRKVALGANTDTIGVVDAFMYNALKSTS